MWQLMNKYYLILWWLKIKTLEKLHPLLVNMLNEFAHFHTFLEDVIK
jgi:hypothetical protein